MWTKKKITISIVVGIILAVFAVPLIIHWAYTINRPKIFTDWGATEVLLYWGSALGGLAALVSMLIVVWHDDKKREDDIKRNDKQREDDRDFYKEERKKETQHNKEQREEDRKIRLKTERYGIISKHLHDSLCNLDMRAFFVINEEADEYNSNRFNGMSNNCVKKVSDFIAPNAIPALIENANRNVLLGLVFFSDEKPFFNHVIEKLKELTKNYTSLLRRLEEHKDSELSFTVNGAMPILIKKFLEENRDLCRKYEEMHTSIENAMADYEQSYNPRPLQMDDSHAAPLSTSSDTVGGDGCVDS